MLGLDIAYLRTKFDDCSFSGFRDRVGAHQNVSGLRDLTTPLSGMICHLLLKVKVKVGFFYSATYSGNAATSRAIQS